MAKKKAVRRKPPRKSTTKLATVASSYLLGLGYLDSKARKWIFTRPKCDHSIKLEVYRLPDGSEQVIAVDAHQHAARAGNDGKPESVCWKNNTQYSVSLVFDPKEWPFASGYTVILVPAGGSAGPFTIYVGTHTAGHDYEITPQPPSKAGPPGTPEVIVD